MVLKHVEDAEYALSRGVRSDDVLQFVCGGEKKTGDKSTWEHKP